MSRPAATDAPCYLALDLGASSGRAVLGTLEGDRMRMDELHRFRTPLIESEGHLLWDVDALWVDIRVALDAAHRAAPGLRSVSVDSWAVDYVPLDVRDRPVRLPYAYRDPRTKGRMDRAAQLNGGADALYERTGIQFLELNTLPQIVADVEDEPALLARTTARLTIAEYFLFLLSGRKVAERTMASTTQLMDARTATWSESIIRAAGDDPARWPQIVAPGTRLGPVHPELMPAGPYSPQVLATCAHDTAAAVAAVPASGDAPWAYISSGTWSLVGAELRSPILTREARRAGFTNEAGLDGTIRFLKNRTGMWVLEECCREWAAAGDRPSYDALFAAAALAPPAIDTIDLDAAPFAERGGMPAKIAAACRARHLQPPADRGGLVRLILESLAATYARTLHELEQFTGERTEDVHVVGGGSRVGLLCALTADATNRRVLAGPDEATVLGNLLVQARALGDLPGHLTLREVARRSTTLTEYLPRTVATSRTASPAAS